MNLKDFEELLRDRNLSQLYVEIYEKPTGFHSIESLKESIGKQNKIINKYSTKPDYALLINEYEESFKLSAITYFALKYPVILDHIIPETKKYLFKNFGLK